MKDSVLCVVKKFLSSHFEPGRPVLLGFSGGGDSLALLHLLLECRRFFQLNLHLAHLDHGWREESGDEARKLQTEASLLSLPFHMERVSFCASTSNLEEKGREQRILFFQKIYQKVGAQALILAHQKEDLAETVLKRIFEGASLFSLSAMQPVSNLRGMIVWRPLLPVSKKELCKWLEVRSLIPIQDPTNKDHRFLRSRMRESLFPEIERVFGKQVITNLCLLAKEANMCKISYEEKFRLLVQQEKVSPWVSYLDCNQMDLNDCFEIQAFLRFFLKRYQMVPSKSQLETMAQHIKNCSANKIIEISNKKIGIDRGRLILFIKPIPPFEGSEMIAGSGKDRKLYWSWEIGGVSEERKSVWPGPLSGEFSAVIPYEEKLELISFSRVSPTVQKQVTGLYAQGKIPVFFKSLFPVVIIRDQLVCEFLSGFVCSKNNINNSKKVNIKIKICDN